MVITQLVYKTRKVHYDKLYNLKRNSEKLEMFKIRGHESVIQAAEDV